MSKFSVVIPLFNKAKTIKRALESVLGQSFEDFEVIVVDDGSNDEGPAVVQACTDNRIRLLTQQNGGPGSARNRGINAATGSWIAFLDADDIWFADHLIELDQLRLEFPQARMVATRFLARADAEAATDHVDSFNHGAERSLIDPLAAIGEGPAPFFTSSLAVEKQALDHVGGFKALRLGEDRELLVRLSLAFPTAASTRQTVIYSIETGGIMDSNRDRWSKLALAHVEDLAPAVATALKLRDEPRNSDRRYAIDKFVDRYVGYAMGSAIMVCDVGRIRQLTSFYRIAPDPKHRPYTLIARLPAVIATAILRLAKRMREAR